MYLTLFFPIRVLKRISSPWNWFCRPIFYDLEESLAGSSKDKCLGYTSIMLYISIIIIVPLLCVGAVSLFSGASAIFLGIFTAPVCIMVIHWLLYELPDQYLDLECNLMYDTSFERKKYYLFATAAEIFYEHKQLFITHSNHKERLELYPAAPDDLNNPNHKNVQYYWRPTKRGEEEDATLPFQPVEATLNLRGLNCTETLKITASSPAGQSSFLAHLFFNTPLAIKMDPIVQLKEPQTDATQQPSGMTNRMLHPSSTI